VELRETIIRGYILNKTQNIKQATAALEVSIETLQTSNEELTQERTHIHRKKRATVNTISFRNKENSRTHNRQRDNKEK